MSVPFTCPRCGAPIQAGQRFCANCALPLDDASLAAYYAERARQPATPALDPAARAAMQIPGIAMQDAPAPAAPTARPAMAKPASQFNTAGAVLIVGLVAICTLFWWIGQTNRPAGSTTLAPNPPAATHAPEAPITVQGSTGQKSQPFTLKGGNYKLSWTCANRDSTQWNFIADLVPVGGQVFSGQPIANVIVPANTNQTGDNMAYSVKGGQWYVDATVAQCPWTVTISPVP